MNEDIKISKIQFFVIVCMFLSGGSMLILPSIAAQEAEQNAWISIILSVGIGLLAVILFVRLGSKFPKLTFVQYSEMILGSFFGKVVSIIFLIGTFTLSATLLWDISILGNVQMLPETPMLAIDLLLLIIVVMGARYGLEVIARTGEILIPWAIVLFVIPILFLIPYVKWDNLLPIFDQGIKPILRSSYSVTAIMFIEGYVLLMIMPYVSEQKAIFKTYILGTALSGLVLLITVLYCLTVFGASNTGSLTFPTYTLAKLISVGRIFERIEAVIASIWVITIYYKATISFYVTVLGSAQMFKIKNVKPLFIPFAFILLPFAVTMYQDMPQFRLVAAKYFPLIDYTIGLFIPLLMWAVYHMRKKKIQQKLEAASSEQ